MMERFQKELSCACAYRDPSCILRTFHTSALRRARYAGKVQAGNFYAFRNYFGALWNCGCVQTSIPSLLLSCCCIPALTLLIQPNTQDSFELPCIFHRMCVCSAVSALSLLLLPAIRLQFGRIVIEMYN